MSLLRRILSFWSAPATESPAPPRRPPPSWAEGYGYLGAVGESQYQPALQRIARRNRLCWATLIPEPDNPFDVNAVVVKVDQETVGYLPRSHCRRYQRRLLTLATPLDVPAKIIGGTRDKPHFGILLNCREVEHMPTPKRVRSRKPAVDPSDQPF